MICRKRPESRSWAGVHESYSSIGRPLPGHGELKMPITIGQRRVSIVGRINQGARNRRLGNGIDDGSAKRLGLRAISFRALCEGSQA
jgi:hypothetical protein